MPFPRLQTTFPALNLWEEPWSGLNKEWKLQLLQVPIVSRPLLRNHSVGDSVSQDSTLHESFLLFSFLSQMGRSGRARFFWGAYLAIFNRVVTFSNPGNPPMSEPPRSILQTAISWKTILQRISKLHQFFFLLQDFQHGNMLMNTMHFLEGHK